MASFRSPIADLILKSEITHYPLPITHYPLPITHYQNDRLARTQRTGRGRGSH